MDAKESCRFGEGHASDVNCQIRTAFWEFQVNEDKFTSYATIEHHNNHSLLFFNATVGYIVHLSMTCWCIFLRHILSITARSSVPVIEFGSSDVYCAFCVLPETAVQKHLSTLDKNELNRTSRRIGNTEIILRASRHTHKTGRHLIALLGSTTRSYYSPGSYRRNADEEVLFSTYRVQNTTAHEGSRRR